MTGAEAADDGLPLAGLTVVALEQAVAAPFASRQLADLGARVIKVERPDGGDFARRYDEAVFGESSYFVWLNRSKESIRLDVKDPDDLALLRRMVADADVFLQNLAPGAAERAGLGPDELRAEHPRLVTCSISGYGRTGPYARKKAYDLLVQCESGLLSVTGTEQDEAKVGVSIVDIAAGMYAYSGILAALFARSTTGRGRHVDVSMLDAIAEWLTQPYLYGAHTGSPPPRSGARHASIAPYGPFRVGDGGKVFVAVQNEREWERFCADVLRRPELSDDERFATNTARVAHVDALTSEIESAFAGRSRDEVVAELDAADIASAELRSVMDLGVHPQIVAHGRWQETRTESGTTRVPLAPGIVAGPRSRQGVVPALGQDDEALREEFAPRRADT
ncbi:MAG: CoA transferase [Acidothermales bacterium]|nr:CoA transferase [Acidothermales bacterium]